MFLGSYSYYGYELYKLVSRQTVNNVISFTHHSFFELIASAENVYIQNATTHCLEFSEHLLELCCVSSQIVQSLYE